MGDHLKKVRPGDPPSSSRNYAAQARSPSRPGRSTPLPPRRSPRPGGPADPDRDFLRRHGERRPQAARGRLRGEALRGRRLRRLGHRDIVKSEPDSRRQRQRVWSRCW